MLLDSSSEHLFRYEKSSFGKFGERGILLTVWIWFNEFSPLSIICGGCIGKQETSWVLCVGVMWAWLELELVC